ncbi:SDR family oxidoreductase [Sneathiella sp. HT1-7]|nr:SDR family oxidoreductase [Sneathiella sp. HT1-7]MCC3303359.1 SDR family oxidoreductase [Sneathiella sp. HT1-7]
MNDLDFTGKTALIVGGSSGIGNGIAHALKDRGADVFVWGTRSSATDYDGAEGSDLTSLHYEQMDVSDYKAIADYKPAFEKLDMLILSQGIVVYNRGEFEMPGWLKVIDTNLNSLMACASKFQGMLKEANGSLVIISSTAGYHATKGNPAYNASKTGAIGLTRTLGQAWAGDGIRVNGVAPGLVDTKLTKVTTDNPKRRDAAISTIPQGRLGTPDDIAGAVLYLVSPLASYVVGQTIVVDGGLIL